MKYLITGGCGFIGSNFVRYLYKTYKDVEVVVLDKMTYAANQETAKEFLTYPLTFIQGDICDPIIVKQAMEGVDVVVNFAAESAVDRSISNPGSFLNTDVLGVYVLLHEAMKHKLHRFIQISTDEVYGQIMNGSFTEESELKPRNPYAASKLGGDRLAYSYFVTYGVPVIVTRASNNYGPYSYPEKIIPLFITNILEDQKLPLYGDGCQVRDWLFVEDHCRAIDLLIFRGFSGEVYNIGGNEEMSNVALALKILFLMGEDVSRINFVKDRPGHDRRYSLDCSKIKQLGWEPIHSIEYGLQHTIDWYKRNDLWWREIKNKMDKRYVSGYWGQT